MDLSSQIMDFLKGLGQGFDPDLRFVSTRNGRWAAGTTYMPEQNALTAWLIYDSVVVHPRLVISKTSRLKLLVRAGKPTAVGSIGQVEFLDQNHEMREAPHLYAEVRVEEKLFEYLWERSIRGVADSWVEVSLGVRGFSLGRDEFEDDSWDFKNPLDVRRIDFVFSQQTQTIASNSGELGSDES